MRNPKTIFVFMLIFSALFAQAQPNFALVGFATQNGGTKGGQGGTTVTATTYAQLKSYAESTTPYIIMVEGTISNGTPGGQIRIKSNKSIIGVGSTAFLSGVGLDVTSQNNIIVQKQQPRGPSLLHGRISSPRNRRNTMRVIWSR